MVGFFTFTQMRTGRTGSDWAYRSSATTILSSSYGSAQLSRRSGVLIAKTSSSISAAHEVRKRARAAVARRAVVRNGLPRSAL